MHLRSSVSRPSWARVACAALVLALVGSNALRARDYFVDGSRGKDRGKCTSSPGRGAAACRTISYVIKNVKLAGHTVHVAAGTYREAITIGPADSGTADKPVVLTTDGAEVFIEGLEPVSLADGAAVPCTPAANCAGDKKPYPGVWRFDVAGRSVKGVIETVWKDIRVDDSTVTGVVFDLTRPIPYYAAADVAEVDRISGSYFHDGGKLFVHPYGDVAPGTAVNDVELIGSETVVTLTGADHVTLDGFTVRYAGATGVLVTEDSDDAILKNLTVHSARAVGVWISKGADRTTLENVDVSHVYSRKKFTNPDRGGSCHGATCGWYNNAAGTGIKLDGGSPTGSGTAGHVLRDVTAYNAWNVLSAERVNNSRFDNVLVKNSPNHTFIMNGTNANDGSDPGNCTGNEIVRSFAFNGQDAFFIRGCTRGRALRNLGSFDFFDRANPSEGDSHGWTMLSNLAKGVNVEPQSHPGWKADYNWHDPEGRNCRWTGKSRVDCRKSWPTLCSCNGSGNFGTVVMTGARWPIVKGLEASRYTRADFAPAPGSSVIDAGSPDLDGDGVLETGPGGDDECTPARHCAGGRPDIGPVEHDPARSKR